MKEALAFLALAGIGFSADYFMERAVAVLERYAEHREWEQRQHARKVRR